MKFVSPYTLPGVQPSENFSLDRRELQLARKRLMADIDLSDSQTVKINEQEYTKDDILKLFEEYDNEQVLVFHQLIAKDKAFLSFLEKGFISDKNNIQLLPEYDNSEFRDFVSPYFREQYEPLLQTYYKKKDYVNLIKLLRLNRFMNLSDEEACFRKCYEEMNESVEKLSDTVKDVRKGNLFSLAPETGMLYSKNYISSVSLFPDFFMELRNRLAQQLILLYVECYNVMKRSDISGEIIRNLFFLKTDEEMRNEIKRREQEYNNATRSTAAAYSGSSSSSSSSGSGAKFGVYGIIFVIGLILKLTLLSRSCGGRSHDYSSYNNYNFNPPSYRQAEEAESGFTESNENKNFLLYLDSLYSNQSHNVKIAKSGEKKFPQPQRLYSDVLTHDGFFYGNLKDTAELVLSNVSGYELVVFLSGKSGVTAWYIPPGDSVNLFSSEISYNVYFEEGRDLTLKKKYGVFDYDPVYNNYKKKGIPIKVFKNTALDSYNHMLNAQQLSQKKISHSGVSDQRMAAYEQLQEIISQMGHGKGIYIRRKVLSFSGDNFGLDLNVREETVVRATAPEDVKKGFEKRFKAFEKRYNQ